MTTEQKWARVDEIINKVECRKAIGLHPFECGLDEYVYQTFGTVGASNASDNID